MEDAEPPEMRVLLRALLGRALLSRNSVIQINQSYEEQLSFVPNPVRNGRQSLQAPHSTRDTSSVPTPDPFPPLTLLGLGVGTCRSKSRSCLLLSLQTINAFSCGPAEGLEAD